MNCRFCGINPNVIVPLPFQTGDDPKLSPCACIPCATEKGYYCPIHSRTFTSSTCGHPFCIECIETEVQLRKEEAEKLYSLIKKGLSHEQLAELEEAAQDVAAITNRTEAVAVLRFVATLAHRKRISFDEAVVLATSDGAVDELLPVVLS